MKLLINKESLSSLTRSQAIALENTGWCFTSEKKNPMIFFYSLGNWPEHYSITFEAVLNKPYLLTLDQIQSSLSDKCAEYCIYYVACRCAGLDMQTLLNVFNINNKEGNDEIISSLTHIEN